MHQWNTALEIYRCREEQMNWLCYIDTGVIMTVDYMWSQHYQFNISHFISIILKMDLYESVTYLGFQKLYKQGNIANGMKHADLWSILLGIGDFFCILQAPSGFFGNRSDDIWTKWIGCGGPYCHTAKKVSLGGNLSNTSKLYLIVHFSSSGKYWRS